VRLGCVENIPQQAIAILVHQKLHFQKLRTNVGVVFENDVWRSDSLVDNIIAYFMILRRLVLFAMNATTTITHGIPGDVAYKSTSNTSSGIWGVQSFFQMQVTFLQQNPTGFDVENDRAKSKRANANDSLQNMRPEPQSCSKSLHGYIFQTRKVYI